MRRGERRPPLCGIGGVDDNERWFRIYGTEVLADISLVSAPAALLYIARLTSAYSQMGYLRPWENPRVCNFWFSVRKAKAAINELRVAGLIVGPNDMPRHYDPRHHGFAIQRKPIPAGIRDHVFERDGNACVYCGGTDRLTLDHVIPVSDRGTDRPANLVTACLRCNISKGRRAAGEFANG